MIFNHQNLTFFAGGLDYALRQASWSGILIVVVLLLVSSLSWAVMVTKYRALERATKSSRDFLVAWKAAANPLEIYAKGERFEASPHYRIYHEACRCLTEQLLGSSQVDDSLLARLDACTDTLGTAQMETVQLSMQRSVGESGLRLESQTALLATAVSGGPFLGLLGTVWGVMDTFSGIAASTSAASVKDMAPGVAAALVTTVVGLLVAIPAMFGYNWLVNRVRAFLVSMDNFAAELAVALNLRWLSDGTGGPRPFSMRPSAISALARPVVSEDKMPWISAPQSPPPSPHVEPSHERNREADPESGLSEDL